MRGPKSLFILFFTPLQRLRSLALVESGGLKKKLVEKLRGNFRLSLFNDRSEDLPAHLKVILPKASKEFLGWFSGFADGEGYFKIVVLKNWTYISLNFSIELHIDDVEVLYKIRKNLGVGEVEISKTRSSAIFHVSNFEDITSVLIPILKEFPLQTTKYLDFISFANAALIKLNSKSISPKGYISYNNFSAANLDKLKKLKEGMNSKRLVIKPEQENFLKDKVSINKWWLLGFVEGEGTFGYKHLVPYFQLAQNEKNLFVLEAIENYLLNTFNLSRDLEVFKYSLNKGTGVYSLVIYTVDMQFYYLLPFFESMTFLSRKGIDYIYWVFMVLIHKLGYYYLPEGKKIALEISQSTNKYRYTTNNSNKVELVNCELISKLLAQTPPFDISTGSHSELVRKFTIAKRGREGFIVYIYESSESNKLKELKGSPFSTYGDGHESIGLIRRSRVIGRYIDTGKKYKDKYLFSSVPLDI